ncbi:hypothetical protein KQX54_009376 [Cotesia glomerata]|uniref:Uncharacterized protein n=1 Tax=Cotesia glomerata TaxID=32391 RepID=A0AAV7I1P2_COTGL|nr:hypothetical protein KQX54_009376 [Cotesia glomerata]
MSLDQNALVRDEDQRHPPLNGFRNPAERHKDSCSLSASSSTLWCSPAPAPGSLLLFHSLQLVVGCIPDQNPRCECSVEILGNCDLLNADFGEGLQAALVKLDPATTVTPIGSGVKLLSSRHNRTTFVNVDDNDLTVCNVLNTSSRESRQVSEDRLKVEQKISIDNQQNQQNCKCPMVEVR